MFIIVCCCFCCSGRGIVNTHRGICWNNIEVVRALGNVVCFSLSVRKLKYWIYHVCLRLSHVCLRRFKNRHVKTMIPYFYKQTTTTTTTHHTHNKTSLFVRRVCTHHQPGTGTCLCLCTSTGTNGTGTWYHPYPDQSTPHTDPQRIKGWYQHDGHR